MSNTVTIGCRLPSGLILEVNGKRVELQGQRQAQEGREIILLGESDFGVTEVDAAYWEAFKKEVGPEFAPLKSKAIFEAKNEKEAKAIHKEVKKEKTGHEPLPQTQKGVDGKPVIEKA
ncbi:hypothetical protein MAJJADAN_00023 [Pseudomonas phage Amjad_SA]|nr:hypothetical protein MAJJADAN_00023 [Pseudomonas phage Amjad_SA]